MLLVLVMMHHFRANGQIIFTSDTCLQRLMVTAILLKKHIPSAVYMDIFMVNTKFQHALGYACLLYLQ
ncbi:hypothetical protein [Moraxella lacunata]|uniref:hypothetical protein n=1 Tax=Moraxella lacunata TaxID=477 RepID=UPI003EE1D96A